MILEYAILALRVPFVTCMLLLSLLNCQGFNQFEKNAHGRNNTECHTCSCIDAKQEFDGKCSVQVYSIQACLPKDPATLWNHEFVQAEDLFKQPSTADNCLRDNRFCGVSNSFVKRTVGGTPSIPQAIAAPQSIQKKNQNAGSVAGAQPPSIAKPVKTEGNAKPDLAQVKEKEKVPRSIPNNKKGQNDKNSSASGGSLASMWGRASAMPKPDATLVQADNARQVSSG